TFTGCYRLGNIDAIQLRLQKTEALRSVGIAMARPNVIGKAFASHKCREAKRALTGSAEVPLTKRRPNGRQIRFKWYEKTDLSVGYVGLVRSVRAKDNNCQSACGEKRK